MLNLIKCWERHWGKGNSLSWTRRPIQGEQQCSQPLHATETKVNHCHAKSDLKRDLIMAQRRKILSQQTKQHLDNFFFLYQEKSGSSWSVKSPVRQDGDYKTCKGLAQYPMVTPRVCVSPTSSHDVTTRDDYRKTAEPGHCMRCSFPSLSPKCSLFRDVSLNFQGYSESSRFYSGCSSMFHSKFERVKRPRAIHVN